MSVNLSSAQLLKSDLCNDVIKIDLGLAMRPVAVPAGTDRDAGYAQSATGADDAVAACRMQASG
jgi:hypothetical protein